MRKSTKLKIFRRKKRSVILSVLKRHSLRQHTISHKQAVDKAMDEYKKYKARTLSTVEEDYLNSIKILEKKTEKKQ